MPMPSSLFALIMKRLGRAREQQPFFFPLCRLYIDSLFVFLASFLLFRVSLGRPSGIDWRACGLLVAADLPSYRWLA
ncbi:hypothetical protein [Pandoravirus japonicus]|uniref:Uncharacterized protein n=1 Tax=Pandoravirus japonicus TaxID=2823154 RepID=A0A811BTR2_9VIRU|nr:hypothetical protein [Pandoravirus japonicus]